MTIKQAGKIYVIILNYNGWADTIECLESIFRNGYPACQVIVVDNASSDNSLEYLKDWAEGGLDILVDKNHYLRHLFFPPVSKSIPYVIYSEEEINNRFTAKSENNSADRVTKDSIGHYPIIFIQAKFNKGFAAGNNLGIKYAMINEDLDSVILLNNDTVIKPDALKNLIAAKDLYGNEAVYGGRIYYYAQPYKIWFDGGYFNPWLGKARHINMDKNRNEVPCDESFKLINFMTFCFALLPVDIIKRVGLFDEDFFMYGEDLEYSYRLIESGCKIYQICNSEIFHKVGASSGKKASSFSVYWNFRNNIRFIRKFLKFRHKLSAFTYIFATRLIWFPVWLIQKKNYIIINQIKGVIDGFKKIHLS